MALVAVAGDALLDVLVEPRRSPVRGGDVPARTRLAPGGQGANLAVRLARRGCDVRLACALGDDAGGRLLRERLGAEGVALAPIATAGTGSVVVIVHVDGERTMLSDRVPFGSSLDLVELASDAEWLVISGYIVLEATRALATAASLPGRRAVIGSSLVSDDAASWASTVTVAAPDLVVLNADEAAVLTSAVDPMAAATRLARRFSALVVVTHRDGASAADGVLSVDRPTDAATAIDTTGAGDAYAGALLAALAGSDWPPARARLEDAMAAAASAAAAVAGVPGAQARVAGEIEATLGT